MLNNWRKHRAHRGGELRAFVVDPYSSATAFHGWRDFDPRELDWPSTFLALPVWQPKTWLLYEGWRKHGLISTYEVPSSACVE